MKPSHLLSMLVAITASILHPAACAGEPGAENRLLEQLQSIAPAGVEVRSLDIDKDQVRIEGRCTELSRVAELLRLIGESTALQAPTLRSLERSSDGQLDFLIASVTTPPSP